MKVLVVFLVISCAVVFSECMTKEERVAAFAKIVKDCANKEGATDADVDELLSHKSPSARGGKCIQACFTEKFGILKDNKVSPEGTAIVAKLAFDGDAAKVQLFSDLAVECGDITDSDRCEAAFKIVECGHHGIKSKGMTFEDL